MPDMILSGKWIDLSGIQMAVTNSGLSDSGVLTPNYASTPCMVLFAAGSRCDAAIFDFWDKIGEE
jgi:hypothetical protein